MNESVARGALKFTFPKSSRILRSGDFRRVYDEGFRVTGPFFAAFCRKSEEAVGSKVGFTTPRALGRAVARNRIKRRLREAVRGRMAALPPGWQVVFNPRRSALIAGFEALGLEVERVFVLCARR